MNIKNYFKKGLLTLTAATALLAGTVSCSSEVTTQEAPVSSTHKVTFTLGNATLTRASASTGGFDREKAIDPAKFYIVAFQGGSWIKTISPQDLTYADGEPGTLSFDMVALGTINFYFVANTTDPTKLTGLTSATTESNFFTVVDNTPVGENGATTDGFLMVGKVENVSVSGAATDLGTVTMTRRAARIDIDGSDIADLVIKSVTVNKRYNGGSLLVREGSNTAVTGTPVQTKYITTGTPGANEMLVSATTDDALVSDDQWQGVIYGYENPVTDTEVTIDVEFDGFARSATAKFSEAKDASGNTDPKAVIANTLYTIKLVKAGEGTDPTQQLAATIEVVDWNDSELNFTDLADSEQPSFTSTTDGGTTTLSNPATIRVSKTDATTVDLTVTSGGVFASTLNFIEGQDDNGDALAYNPSSSARALHAATRAVSGTTIAPTETNYENGHIVQTYSLPISAELGTQLGSRGYLKFRVLNAFDQTSYREFYIRADYTITATLSQTEYTYDGIAKEPTLATLTVINDEGQEESILSETSTYTVTYNNNTNAGTATAVVTFVSGTYEGNGTSVEFTINKAKGQFEYAEAMVEKYFLDDPYTHELTYDNNGAGVSYAITEGVNVVTIDALSGEITFKENTTGTVKVKATVTDGDNYYYEPNTAEYTLTVIDNPWEGIAVGNVIYEDATWTASYDATWASEHGAAVGIVFSTETSDYDKSQGWTNGYAISLKNGTNNANWCGGDYVSTQLTDVLVTTLDGDGSAPGVRTDLDGYKHCQTVLSTVGESNNTSNKLAGLYEAMNFSTLKAPKYTSGWYMPSIGQLYLFLTLPANSPFTGTETIWGEQMGGSSQGYQTKYWNYYTSSFNTQIDTWLANSLTGAVYDNFNVYTWSSTEYDSKHVYCLSFGYGQVQLVSNLYPKQGSQSGVRPVFAF